MTGSVKGGTVCQYTFAVCGVSLLLSLLTSFLLVRWRWRPGQEDRDGGECLGAFCFKVIS